MGKKRIRIMAMLLLALFVVTGCGKSAPTTPNSASEPKRYTAEFTELFDTVTQVAGYAADEAAFTQIASDIKQDMTKYHQMFDIFHTYPNMVNIKTLNDNAGKGKIVIPVELFDLLEFCKKMYTETEGRVNIAFGSVLRIWQEYRDAGIANPAQAKLPPMEKLTEANKNTSIESLALDRSGLTAEIKNAAVQLDVGAIAKGYATEIVAAAAAKRGVDNILLSVGGNVRAIGLRNKAGDPWRIGIKNPDTKSEQKNVVIAKVKQTSMVTSGGYQRFYTVAGKEYCHIIDPDTLFPDTTFLSVTIMTPDSGIADTLSTALFNLSEAKGRELLRKFGAEALWVYPDMKITMTDGFKPLIENK